MGFFLALGAGTARRIGEIGFIVGAIGGLLVMVGAASGSRSGSGRASLMLAGLCIAVGFVLGIIFLHWGK
jgi:hypothetical protein